MIRIIICLLLLLPIQSMAENIEDKTRKLFEVQGVLANYQNLIDQGRAQAKEDTKKVMDQMLSQLNPSKEFQDRLSQAAEKYLKAILTDRTADQLVEVLIKYYAPQFTEQELDGLIAFYGSDLGKKDAAVSRDSSQHLIQYYKAENERIRVSATNDFIKDIQLIASQCNCVKKPLTKKKK